MLFNSFEFAIFLPIVFLLYWFVFNKQVKWQNLFILFVSYIFYGWWDWRFLLLIAFSTTLDFWVGVLLGRIEDIKKRKLLFSLSCIVNLGFLGFFKYFNFFTDNFIAIFESIGYHIPSFPLKIILPVGISFYTFQSLSYTADIYLKKLKPTKDFILFATFISFFPQLVAGPIERAINLLPQFQNKRRFNYEGAKHGMQQILWGLFKKIVIADTLSVYVDQIFGNYQTLPGSTLLLGAIYFSVQIYCDFSGYSSIAIGTARLFGFTLMKNFSYPYFSKNVAEFWRNWHISLSTWFRDYVYIPLGGSRCTLKRTLLNTLIVFALSGFWHGANWTFIAWGILNGIFIIPIILSANKEKIKPSLIKIKAPSVILEILQIVFTFSLITLTWIFFRSKNISQAFNYLKILFSKSLFRHPVQHGMTLALPLIFILFIIEFILKKNIPLLQPKKIPAIVRWSVYLTLAIICLAFFKQNQAFIYFQF
jgi:alginate O-acetyltransferase complex protein AlgI